MVNLFANAQQDGPVERPDDHGAPVRPVADAPNPSGDLDAMFGPAPQESEADREARLRDERERIERVAAREQGASTAGRNADEPASPPRGPAESPANPQSPGGNTNEAVIETKPAGEVFRQARQKLLADPNEPKGRTLSRYEVVNIDKPVSVMTGEGEPQAFDPAGQQGQKATHLVRDQHGNIRAITPAELEEWEQQSEKVAAAQQNGGKQTRIGLLASLMMRRSEKQEARARELAEQRLSARDKASYSQYEHWTGQQAVDQARKARHEMEQANQAYREIARNGAIKNHLNALQDINRKIQDGTATQDDYNNKDKAYREIDRTIHNDPALSSRLQDMREHVDNMTAYHREAMRRGEQVSDRMDANTDEAFRREIPGEKEMNGLAERYGNVTKQGNKDGEEAKRMEEIRETAKRIAAFIKNLFTRDQKAGQAAQAQMGGQ